jgi:hypothetical protein
MLPNGTAVYVCVGSNLAVITPATNTLLTTITGAGGAHVLASPDSTTIYSSGWPVTIVSTATNTITKSFPPPRDPGLREVGPYAITPDGLNVYYSEWVSLLRGQQVSVYGFNTTTFGSTADIRVKGVAGIAITPAPIPLFDIPPPAYAAAAVPYDTAGAGGAGPSAADAVNLVSGVYENDATDAVVRNPNGPGVVFSRHYRSVSAYNGVSSPGLSVGWTHNYDCKARQAVGGR